MTLLNLTFFVATLSVLYKSYINPSNNLLKCFNLGSLDQIAKLPGCISKAAFQSSKSFHNDNWEEQPSCKLVNQNLLKIPKKQLCPKTNKEFIARYGEKLSILNECDFEQYVVQFAPFLRKCLPVLASKSRDIHLYKYFLHEVLLNQKHLYGKIHTYRDLILWVYERADELGGENNFSNDEKFGIVDVLWDNGLQNDSIDLSVKIFESMEISKTSTSTSTPPSTLLTEGSSICHEMISAGAPSVMQSILMRRFDLGLELARKVQNNLLTPLMTELKSDLDRRTIFSEQVVMGVISNGVIQQLNLISAVEILTALGLIDESDECHRGAMFGKSVARELLERVDFGQQDMDKFFSMSNAFSQKDSLGWLVNSLRGEPEKNRVRVDYTQEEQKLRWGGVAGVEGDNGNWASSSIEELYPAIESGGGGVDRRKNLSTNEFRRDYVDKGRPVVVDGMIDEWGAIRAWRKNEFVEKYGHNNVTLLRSGDGGWSGDRSSRPDIKTFVEFLDHAKVKEGAGALGVNLEGGDEMLRSKAGGAGGARGRFPYLFMRDFPIGREVLEDYEEVGIFISDDKGNHNWNLEKRRSMSLFILGAPGAGTGFHAHTAAYNVLLFGVKRWFLIPPHVPYLHDNDKDLPWFKVMAEQELRKLPHKPIIFDQYPGETIYIPTEWKHATVNMEVCVGIAVEMGDESYLRW